ncbi:hypothetical protein BJX65DRAFT_305536 [Aspergillus insuetus]
MVTDSIAHTLNECLGNFVALTASDDLARYEAEVSRQRWLDELGRLRIWSGNIGAHQQGQSSLDHRLRDASHLKSETIKLLNRILRLLEDVRDIVHHTGDGDDIEMEVKFEDDDEPDDTTELQHVYQSVAQVVNLLFQISMAIRNPAAHDRLLHLKVKDESHFEFSYQQHVSHKYPDLAGDIFARLGSAMARQRAILKYRERHRAKLGKGLSEDLETGSTQLSETVATEITPGIDQLRFLESYSDSGISQTSYATSLMTAQDSISIPSPPKASRDNAKFECPYCFYIIAIKSQKDWSRHVFRDLMPYVCLAKDCKSSTKLYESRHQWYQHMCEAHSLSTADQGIVCPLCQVPVSSFEKHVGRHLEELALFVLPRADEEEDSDSDPAKSPASVLTPDDDDDDNTDEDDENDDEDDDEEEEEEEEEEEAYQYEYAVSETEIGEEPSESLNRPETIDLGGPANTKRPEEHDQPQPDTPAHPSWTYQFTPSTDSDPNHDAPLTYCILLLLPAAAASAVPIPHCDRPPIDKPAKLGVPPRPDLSEWNFTNDVNIHSFTPGEPSTNYSCPDTTTMCHELCHVVEPHGPAQWAECMEGCVISGPASAAECEAAQAADQVMSPSGPSPTTTSG